MDVKILIKRFVVNSKNLQFYRKYLKYEIYPKQFCSYLRNHLSDNALYPKRTGGIPLQDDQHIISLAYIGGNLLKTVPCVSVWYQNLILKKIQNSSKLALLHSRNMAYLSKKHTGPRPRPLCFAWQVIQISEDVTHWRFVKKNSVFYGWKL